MVVLKLGYPVCTLDNKQLLPAGALLTEEALERLALSGPEDSSPAIPLMEYGTVRQDLLRFLRGDYYGIIFRDPKENADLLRHIGKLRLPLPLLDILGYFRLRDRYTYRHSLTVFALSALLSKDLLGDDGLDAFLRATAGPMHDFGKICVTLRVLQKTTPLLRSERALLEHHTVAGNTLLSYYLKDPKTVAAKVAMEHHERRDGSGYPLGSRLSDRLVEIVVVCDIYDALVSPRPYRKVVYDNRTALEEVTALMEQGRIGIEIVQALVARNRKDKPRVQDCAVSGEKRGKPPEVNMYGIIQDDGPSPSTD
ncbi:MAG TPA: HD domain-containing protein [Candidatus Deferrimicrobium sp.]|nr:HD domain-containing protein [Candidatus Deferrimicrobium sp.]